MKKAFGAYCEKCKLHSTVWNDNIEHSCKKCGGKLILHKTDLLKKNCVICGTEFYKQKGQNGWIWNRKVRCDSCAIRGFNAALYKPSIK